MFTFLAKVSVVAALAVDLNPQPLSEISVEALNLRLKEDTRTTVRKSRKMSPFWSTSRKNNGEAPEERRMRRRRQDAQEVSRDLVMRYLSVENEPPRHFEERLAEHDLDLETVLSHLESSKDEVEKYVSAACASLKITGRSAEVNEEKAAELLAEALLMSENSEEFSKKTMSANPQEAVWVALMHKWATAEKPLVVRKESKDKAKTSRSLFRTSRS